MFEIKDQLTHPVHGITTIKEIYPIELPKNKMDRILVIQDRRGDMHKIYESDVWYFTPKTK